MKEIPGYIFEEYSDSVEFVTLLSKAFVGRRFEIEGDVGCFTVKAEPEFTINDLRSLVTYEIAQATYSSDEVNNRKPIN